MSKNFGFIAFMKAERGFTLIELLVTISIIAVLSALGLVVYTSVMNQGRDARRQSDLMSIQSALEQFYANYFHYPVNSGSCSNETFTIDCPLKDSTGTRVYINRIPKDPLPSPQYQYVPYPFGCNNAGIDCTNYCLCAKLQNSSPGLPTTDPPACNTLCTSAYNFAVSQP